MNECSIAIKEICNARRDRFFFSLPLGRCQPKRSSPDGFQRRSEIAHDPSTGPGIRIIALIPVDTRPD